MIDINNFFYINSTLNIVNYSVLLLSIIILLLEEYNQDRAWILLFTSIFIQTYLCNYLTNCHGILIIYCFILGFLIMKYLVEKKYYKFLLSLLLTLFILFIILYYLFELRYKDFYGSFGLHILFLLAGFIYILIPKNK